jgi:hypothetical protein
MRLVAVAAVLALGGSGAGVALAITKPPQPPEPGTAPTPTVTAPSVEFGSGLFGHVSRGPTAPNCAPTDPCFRPARVALQFWRLGKLRVLVATKATGKYRIDLPAGRYTVRIRRDLGVIKPSTVRVPADGFKRVDFTVSTGIY